jgi:mRNA interferase RelE/StbE
VFERPPSPLTKEFRLRDANKLLAFKEDALKEWHALDNTVREQFKSKLEERLANPHVPASKLSGQKNRYKIKLRK